MAYQKKERRENTASVLTLDLADESEWSTPTQREKRGRDGQRNIDSGIIDECMDLPSFSDPEEYRDRVDSGYGLNEIERRKSPKDSATISEKSSSVLFEEGVDIIILGNSDASDEDHTPTEETGGTFPEILTLEDKQSQGAPEPGINHPSSLSCHHVLSPSATDMGTSSPLKGDPEEKVSGSTTPDTDLSPSEEDAGKYSPHFSDKGNMSSPSLLVPPLPLDISTSVNKNKCPTIGCESLDMPGSAPLYTIPMPTQADLGKQLDFSGTRSLSPYVSPTQENDEKSLVFSGSTKSDCTVPPSQQDGGKFQNGHGSDSNDLLTSRPSFPLDSPPSGTSSSSSSLNLTEYNDHHVFRPAIPAMDDIAADEAEKIALRIQLSEALERIPNLQNTVADLEKTVYELRQQLEMTP